MSNGYDFFGAAGGPTAPSTSGSPAPAAAPSVDRWGMPSRPDAQAAAPAPAPPTYGYAPPSYPPAGFAPTAWQQPPSKQSRNMRLAAGGIVLATAVVAGAVFYFTRPHPISLPPSVGGVSQLATLSSSDKADIKNAEKQLAKQAHIHDISSRVYGDVASGGFYVLAGRINGAETSLADVENQVASTAAGAGANFSTGTVSSGGTDFECVWASPAGHDVSVCFWWSNHSLLFGEGLDHDAQSTADALAEAKVYAGLR